MKDKIEAVKSTNYKNERVIKYYLHCNEGIFWLTDTPYRRSTYEFFRNGVNADKMQDMCRKSDEFLLKTVRRLPKFVEYVKKEVAPYAA